jgi:hypothetical protein
MKIIRATDPIPVEHPVLCVYGQPGIGKSSLGYSADTPLLLDFDAGSHRASNRRDTLQIHTWADVTELLDDKAALEPYKSIVVDTVGRLLDVMTLDIIEQNPKLGRDGSLSLQGFGVLKGRFRGLLTQLRAKGKDVVLLAHHREDKDGDITIMRPDIQGASYGEVMKSADMVGFLYMRGKDRILDFNPTDRWHGKNPVNWKPLALPPVAKALTVLAELIAQGRAALGSISDESAKVAEQIFEWRTQIDTYTTPEECTKAITQVAAITPEMAKVQVKRLLWDKAKALGFTFDDKAKAFHESKPVAVPA